LFTGPLHERIAADLRTAIVRGDHLPGTKLPTEAELAQRFGAGRGTVRAALRSLEADGLVTSRQGSGRIVLGGSVSQSFADLRSFAQWARSTGRSPGGLFISRVRRPAEPIEAAALQTAAGTDVLYTVRLRTLDGAPALVERCTYPGWLADTIRELDERCASVTAEVRRLTGMAAESGTHTLDVTRADSIDSQLLGCPLGAPILRRRAITRRHDGVPVDYTDDHYAEGAASFTLHNSLRANALSRYLHVTTANPPEPHDGSEEHVHFATADVGLDQPRADRTQPVALPEQQQPGAPRSTPYPWGPEDTGMNRADVARLRELEAENTRLKRIVADLALDIQELKGRSQRDVERP
jgi:GntR family transcriptional regulator